MENEEEYDALNDETFGGLEDVSALDDWEQQHEQFAEITESSRFSEQLGKCDLLFYLIFTHSFLNVSLNKCPP